MLHLEQRVSYDASRGKVGYSTGPDCSTNCGDRQKNNVRMDLQRLRVSPGLDLNGDSKPTF
jgi:hypothetical protein